MATTKKLVCLANSRKPGGRCVAGIEVFDGSKSWIRPVSDRPQHAVSEVERQYRNGAEPQVLDIVSVPLLKPRPDGFQRENWLLDPAVRWQKVGRVGWHDLLGLEQHPESLWINGDHTSAGCNDRVPVGRKYTLKDSLKLIRVDGVTIQVLSWSTNQKLKVRARFVHARTAYGLRVTDPVYEEKFQAKGPGNYRLTESFLTVSLAEEFEGYYYKLVAGIIERADVEPDGKR
ncbi:dual OB domain-containing protein [Amycolatopsis magusensis]|uniref:dual OB domain-containing protein n=1 Tax=Amycolatopsis magusensis TaxID=882444 RepID=UPI0037B89BFF